MATVKIGEQTTPVVQIVGRIAPNGNDDGNGYAKLVLHVGWSNMTHEVSNRTLKELRRLGVQVIDNPDDYAI